MNNSEMIEKLTVSQCTNSSYCAGFNDAAEKANAKIEELNAKLKAVCDELEELNYRNQQKNYEIAMHRNKIIKTENRKIRLFEVIEDQVSILRHYLISMNLNKGKYWPKIHIYITPETLFNLKKQMPTGYSRDYEIFESGTILGHPVFIANNLHTRNEYEHAQFLVVNVENDTHD